MHALCLELHFSDGQLAYSADGCWGRRRSELGTLVGAVDAGMRIYVQKFGIYRPALLRHETVSGRQLMF
jgi:hypothetical protein